MTPAILSHDAYLRAVTLRDLVRTVTSAEANELRDEVYASLHEGTEWQWASGA